MSDDAGAAGVIRNLLQYGDLSFRDFVEIALYHPQFGYYAQPTSPVGKEGDYVTAPSLSPLFAFALGRLVHEFLSRAEGVDSQIVDIGCGDGGLIRSLTGPRVGVDRSLSRVPPGSDVVLATSLGEVPPAKRRLVISNELFDALPFARLVQRDEHLHELWVTEKDGGLDWSEHEAEAAYADYFAARGISLEDGQFADVTLEWEAFYDEICRFAGRGLIVTFDYGHSERQLFRGRVRRWGTAAAYSGQRVSRDLLANPGRQDLTAHVNFDDLRRAGERNGFVTLFDDIQAKFLLALGGADFLSGEPRDLAELEARDEARRLLLPDGIGAEIRVLVQAKGEPLEGWSFQRPLW